MRNSFSTLLLVAACLLLSVTMAPAGEVEIWGSTTVQKQLIEPGAEAMAKATGVTAKVIGVGTGKGLIGLIEGRTAVSAASEDLEGAIASARKAAAAEGKNIKIPANLQFHALGRDEIVPIVHRDNPVRTLSWEQLAALNTGSRTNWKDVGGSDMQVQVVTSHAGSATKAILQSMVMKNAQYAPNAIEVKSTRLEINEVSKDKRAIGAVSIQFHRLNPGHTKIVKTEPIIRPLALITIGNPNPEVQKVIDFFRSEAGKEYLQ
jgi:phosphate transport system substrate-binding protein